MDVHPAIEKKAKALINRVDEGENVLDLERLLLIRKIAAFTRQPWSQDNSLKALNAVITFEDLPEICNFLLDAEYDSLNNPTIQLLYDVTFHEYARP